MFVCQTCIILTKTVHFGQNNAMMSSGLILPVPHFVFTLSENDGCRPSILGDTARLNALKYFKRRAPRVITGYAVYRMTNTHPDN